jgi:His-Xaa-Ser system radical SAM maturase HxsC
MPDPIRLRGAAQGLRYRTIARVTHDLATGDAREDNFLVASGLGPVLSVEDLKGYAGVLTDQAASDRIGSLCPSPLVTGYDDLGHLTEGTILAINPNGQTFSLYRPESRNNSIFATGRCNSDCIMCSQPPVASEPDDMVAEHLRIIDLIDEPPESLGITGGEPTLLKDGLVTILERLKERFPGTHIQMLTNGRMYAYPDFAEKIAKVGHERFLSAVPLYADNAVDHDWIVQSKGAFDQTIMGLYNAAERGLQVEIRVVLHKQTIGRLEQLAEFIYRNLPFVSHVALMGLENMGYVKRNWDMLWIDPVDYADVLEKTVRHLFYRRLNVSIYNLQLCVLPRSLWTFARQSISDYKNIYLDGCSKCDVREQCGGLFKSSETRHSRGIRPLEADSGLEAAS